MANPLVSILIILSLSASLARGQKRTSNPAREPVETTVCKILITPSAFNNRMVRVRGYVDASSEYSLLRDEQCDSSLLWLAFADGSSPPQLAAITNGNGTSKTNQTPPRAVQLVRDSDFEKLEHFLQLNAKAKDCASGPTPELEHLSDCISYRITATFVGRIDGVNKSVHEAHRRRNMGEITDRNGFGHMGMFDAQIVVTSVKNVVAVDEAEFRLTPSISR